MKLGSPIESEGLIKVLPDSESRTHPCAPSLQPAAEKRSAAGGELTACSQAISFSSNVSLRTSASSGVLGEDWRYRVRSASDLPVSG